MQINNPIRVLFLFGRYLTKELI